MKAIIEDVLYQNTGSTTAILEAFINRKVSVCIFDETRYKNKGLSDRYKWSDELVLRATSLIGGR